MGDSSNTTGRSNWSGGSVRTCYCGNIVRIFTSKTPTNPGRRFLRCIGKQGQRCSFFEWVDDEVAIIPGLLQRMKYVEEENMRLSASLLEIRESLNTLVCNFKIFKTCALLCLILTAWFMVFT
ncbi:hypothetical protein ACJIZ3_011123 [Penstemon smallii]|uniref:GRF-type domain-containing protein n=1 Tax=Penstemon smallii TaxID=265156 RepID=A0ABD3UKH0_9LAMI